jgi:hypothetical protein
MVVLAFQEQVSGVASLVVGAEVPRLAMPELAVEAETQTQQTMLLDMQGATEPTLVAEGAEQEALA